MVLTLKFNELSGAADRATALASRMNGYANQLQSRALNRLNATPGGGASGQLGVAFSATNQAVQQLRGRANIAGQMASRIRRLHDVARSVDRQVANMFTTPGQRAASRIGNFFARFGQGAGRVVGGIVGGLFAGLSAGVRAVGAFVKGALRATGSFFKEIGRAIGDWYRNHAPDWVRRLGSAIVSVGRIAVIVIGVVLAVVAIVVLAKFALPLLVKAIVVIAKKGIVGAAAKAAKAAVASVAKKGLAKTALAIGKTLSKIKKGIDGALHLNSLAKEHLDIGLNLPKKTTDFIRNIGGGNNPVLNIVAGAIDVASTVKDIAGLPGNFADLRGNVNNFMDGIKFVYKALDLAGTILDTAGVCFVSPFSPAEPPPVPAMPLPMPLPRPLPPVIMLPPGFGGPIIRHPAMPPTMPLPSPRPCPCFSVSIPPISVGIPPISIPPINIYIPRIELPPVQPPAVNIPAFGSAA